MRRALVASLAVVVAVSLTAGADARADDKQAAAQALYDRATALMDEKKFAEACPKLEEVTRLIPDGIGAKMTLAECYEGLGRTASAWSEYKRAVIAAGQKGQKDRVERANRRVRDLEAKLSTITVRVAPSIAALPGLSVRRNDVVLGAGQLGEAVPVDPGTHTITATADGKKPWTKQIEIGAQKTAAVVDVDALIDGPPAQHAGTGPAKPSSATPARETESVRGAWQLPVGLSMAGLGAAAVGTGAALGAMALGRLSDSEADDHCVALGTRFVCDDEGRSAREDARTMGDLSTVLFIAGGTVLVTGILFAAIPFESAPSDASGDEQSGVRLQIGVGPGAMSLHGNF